MSSNTDSFNPTNPTNPNFFLICGPCVIESREHCLNMARELKQITSQLGINMIFKASFDKANRTSIYSYRGVGLDEGLSILQQVKEELNVPILTDIHEPSQCARVAEVCDVLQIPAFLCRQTDLLVAAARTGRFINIKKGQFCNHITMRSACNKIRETWKEMGNNLPRYDTDSTLLPFLNKRFMLTDRGTMFGYQDLVVDFRSLVQMRENQDAYIVQDITHALQQPNRGTKTEGQRHLIPTIGRAAVAVGLDGIFMEVHNDPPNALSDSATQWPLGDLYYFLDELLQIHQATRGRETQYV